MKAQVVQILNYNGTLMALTNTGEIWVRQIAEGGGQSFKTEWKRLKGPFDLEGKEKEEG